jgi:hypothetical protein
MAAKAAKAYIQVLCILMHLDKDMMQIRILIGKQGAALAARAPASPAVREQQIV